LLCGFASDIERDSVNQLERTEEGLRTPCLFKGGFERSEERKFGKKNPRSQTSEVIQNSSHFKLGFFKDLRFVK
jgi:hypothetical protein